MRKVIVLLTIVALSGLAQAGFNAFVIREGASGEPIIQENNDFVAGATEFIINDGNRKAALGSNDINGVTVGSVSKLAITRHDDISRYDAGSGPAVAPYFNMWVTDGAGNYAVVANEPSNSAFYSLFTDNGDGSKSYDLSFADLADKVAKVYETPGSNDGTSWVHNQFGTDLTFADISTLEIAPPPASYIQDSANGVGSGAPDELGTDLAYGFNWIFGDTQSNYMSGDQGYVVSDAVAVPEPATMALLGLGGLMLRRKRRV